MFVTTNINFYLEYYQITQRQVIDNDFLTLAAEVGNTLIFENRN